MRKEMNYYFSISEKQKINVSSSHQKEITMFNPEKILGGLLSNSLGGGGKKAKVGMGMGLIGVAMEAFEHFTEKSSPPKAPPGPGAGPPPPPAGAGRSSLPPGAPPAFQPPSAPPPTPGPLEETEPGASGGASGSDQDAVLLIRAMISAANADGFIDADERGRILDALNQSNLSREEQTFIEQELRSPVDPGSLLHQVKSPEMARRVYTVSLMAITVDTEAEKVYMDNLARLLELDQSTLDDIHEKLGRENP